MKLPPFYDVVAGLVTLILVIAVVTYPLCGVETPQMIGSGFALALGWTFRATVVATNGVARIRGGSSNGDPTTSPPAPPAPCG
jgi:hypothetical protein